MTSKPQQKQNIYSELIRLGAPILVGQLGMIVVSFADNVMVGHYSTPALSSASFVNNLFNVALLTCIGFTYGLTPLLGAMYGRGQKHAIGAAVRLGLRMNILFTIAITAVMGGLYFFLDNLGQDPMLLPLIKPYYLLMLAGMLPVALFNVMAQWSYATDRSRMPMWIILAGNAVNILGNYVLIFGNLGAPEMGLQGAGVATLAARTVCAVSIIAIFFTGKQNHQYRQGYRNPTALTITSRKLWITSAPMALQMAFETGAFSLSAVMAGLLGYIPLAAFQIILSVGTLGFCVYYSLGAAISVKVANASASPHDPRRQMRRVAWAGYRMMLVLMTLASVIFLLFGRNLMDLFTTDTRVLALSYTLIFPLVLYQLGDATQITFVNALRGTARVMPIMWIALVCYLLLGLPVTWLMAFPMGMGMYGIVLSFSVSLFAAGGMFLWFFLRATRQP